MSGHGGVVTAFLLFLVSGLVTSDEAFVSYITPQYGSRNGATQLRVFGTSFDTNLNLGIDVKTKEVFLVSSLNQYVCDVHEAESDERQTVCYSGKMDLGTYYARMKINGVWLEESQYNGGKMANQFKFHVVNWRTPLLSSLNWYTNEPQKLLSISGRLFTSLVSSNQATSTNGATAAITRVWLTSGTCLLYDENNEEYGITLADEGESNWGSVQCKVHSSYVGNQNVSFIVDSDFGRSDPYVSVKRVSADNRIYMVQTYAVVTDVSPKMGSIVGGTMLTISGRHFDDLSDEKAKVFVGGEECTVQSVTDTEIKCITPIQPSVKSIYSGGRGLKIDVFPGITDLSATLNENNVIAPSKFIDYAHPTEFEESSDFFSRSEGFFIPSVTAKHYFILQADDKMEFFFNPDGADKDKAVSAAQTTSASSAVSTPNYSLNAGQEYYFRVHHVEISGSQYFKLGVYVEKTDYTADHTSSSRTEHQTVTISSTVDKEIQKLTFQNWGEQTEIEAKWEVTLVCQNGPGGCVGSSFYFSIFGSVTENFEYGVTTAPLIQLAVNKLVALDGDQVEVSETTSGFEITFKSTRGNWPLEVFSYDPLTITATSLQLGEPKLDTFTFMVNDRVSPRLQVDASESDVASAVLNLFGPTCPTKIQSGMGNAMVYYDGETDSYPSGSRSAEQSFCGSYSLKNPNDLFNEDDNPYILSIYKQVCFGYKGDIADYLRVSYVYSETDDTGSSVLHTESLRYLWNVGLSTLDDEWSHICYDLNARLAADHPKGHNFKVNRVYVTAGSDPEIDLYLDNIFIGTTSLTSNEIQDAIRLVVPSAVPDIKLMSVDVVKTSDEYTLTFNPIECGYNFPLLGFAFTKSGSSNNGVYSFADGTPQIHVERTKAASPPVRGTFGISFSDSSFLAITNFPADIEEDSFKNKLETLEQITEVEVSRTGTCSGYQWDVYFKSPGGNYPEMMADASGLISSPDAATIKITTTVQGGLYMIPIYGDFLRTAHSNPQVQVYINGVPSHCKGAFDNDVDSSCDFNWAASATPSVIDISPSAGSPGSIITITGSGFSTTNNDNTVKIGGIDCQVTTSSEDTIECSLGPSPSGVHDLSVTVAGKGSADIDAAFRSFTVDGQVNSFMPSSGSIHGCTKITITGSGFDSSSEVYIDGNICLVTGTPTYSSIECMTSSGAAGSYSVDVATAGVSVQSSSLFEYTTAGVGRVAALSVTALSAAGGETLTIDGDGFGTSKGQVYFGDSLIDDVTSWADTQIVLTTPSLPHGTYDVKVVLQPIGCMEPKSVSYTFEVSSISPTSGSLAGGTIVTITGQGLTCDTSVKFGDVTCNCLTATGTSLTCETSSAASSYTITNSGLHPTFGIGYGWSPSTRRVVVGDHVTWAWSVPIEVSGAAIGLFTTADSSSKEYDNNGFQFEPSASGRHTVVINTVGDIQYGSGCVDDETTCGVFMRGTIRSVAASTLTRTLIVSLNSQEASYSSGSYEFTFDTSLTPKVTNITPRSGTTDDIIQITGSWFTAGPKVTVGGKTCELISSSATSASCKVLSTEGLTVGTYHEVVVTVDGTGRARNEIRNIKDRTFVLLPLVTSISPTEGSLSGGTKVYIQGSGFCDVSSADCSLTISMTGGSTCDPIESNYNTITCITRAPPIASSGEVVVTVSSVPSTCASTCNFAYAAIATPSVTSWMSDNAADLTMTFTGSGFSTDNSDITVALTSNEITESCVVTSASETEVVCSISEFPVGPNMISISVAGKGFAEFGESAIIDNTALTPNLMPSSGSTKGGTELTIIGNGFIGDDSTTVTIGNKICVITSITYSLITCVTGSGAAGSVDVKVTSNDESYPSANFDYSESATPTVTSITPPEDVSGSTVTIDGSGFGTAVDDVSVLVGEVPCDVTSVKDDQIKCILGEREGGTVVIEINVAGKGLADVIPSFTYLLTITSISPNEGSYGGGQTVEVSGNGFSQNSVITICGNICEIDGASLASTSVMCITPANGYLADGTTDCTITVANGEDSYSTTISYHYQSSMTPEITSVNPSIGGTGGGTLITITGSGFSSTPTVNIDGSTCDVVTAADTTITCTTNSHQGSMQAKVEVTVGSKGIATQNAADFYYIDRWSSVFTWGGTSLPVDKDFVVIQKGQTVLLDTDTAVMTMLLIDGGELIFDEQDGAGVSLHAENILITNGGLLQVGTEASPFMKKAQIVMYGNLRSPELPIYGAKTLAVRNGTLDLHGLPVDNTWARLASTAEAGATEINLQIPVDWRVGDKIVIATTGLRHSQSENEEMEISAISSDQRTLTLTEALTYKHLGVTETLGGVDVDFRAEVGLLTRNVVFRGSDDHAWHDEIAKCKEGFNTGMFATQTCFQGRFGEEVGSDQFGASIMMHSQEPSSPFIMSRIENIEVTYAGQAFRLGRYPIHWHLMGDVQGMYVKSCSIHKTFNRAITIHGTHNLLVESNVVYDIMGGAIFIEDGIETGNIIQYNLAVFVRQSTSLLNDDITPAAYWVTNPDNILRHNHAAGGTHFGFWYRMHKNPDGPSFDPNICQQNVELGTFENNTVHSQGWFGLWIFQTYHPMVGGGCDSTQPSPAKFRTLTTWNCEKGAEWVEGGAIQFNDFVLVNNEDSAIDIKLIEGTEWGEENGAMIKNAHIAGSAISLDTNPKNPVGIILPFAPGLYVNKAHFVNFNQGGVAFMVTHISGTCTFVCGGFYYWVRELTFTDVTRRVQWRWEHEGVLKDLDGSLTGEADGSSVVPFTDLMDTSVCTVQSGDLFSSNAAVPSAICTPGTRFHRIALNNPIPSSLEANNLWFSNQHGNSSSTYQKKRLTHKPGWMLLLPSKEKYLMWFENGEQFTNITYNARYYDFMEDDYIFVSHLLKQRPDVITINGVEKFAVENATDELTADNDNLDWSFDQETLEFQFIVSGKTSSRRKRAAIEIVDDDYRHVTVTPNIYRCVYLDCIGPVDPDSVPPSREQPENAIAWSQADNPCMEKIGNAVVIKKSATDIDLCWVLVDVDTIDVDSITVEGVLQFVESAQVSAIYILVKGGRIIAGFSSAEPYQNDLTIELRGDHDTPGLVLPGVELGSKALGCFGGCDFHGQSHDVFWTHLAETSNAGSTQITLTDGVDWKVGDEIVITTTGYRSEETEKNVITSISNQVTITLQTPLLYRHMGESYEAAGWQYDMRAEVGLLSRNIKIKGASYPNIDEQAFGARVLVGYIRTSDNTDVFGWGRFSNVEFFQTGQEGWTEVWDPRFSLAWLNTGPVSTSRPSFVVGCAFHDGYSTAIGTFGAEGIEIADNVVHRTIHDGIRITGSNHILERNLVTVTLFRGAYLDRYEETNFKDWQASFEVSDAQNLIMIGNTAAGSERLCFHVDGEACGASDENKWTNNVAHGCLHGVQIFIEDGVGSCSMIRDFTIYKAWDYGIYHQTRTNVVIRNTIIADSTVGYLPLIFEPPSLSHVYEDKSATIEDMLCVGRSPHFDPIHDFMDESGDDNLKIRAAGPDRTAPRTPTDGKTCIMLPLFQSSSNGAPFKPFHGNLKYPTIRGLLKITGLHAQSYKSHSDGTRDVVFYTNPANEDIFHPTIIQGSTILDVEDASKVFFNRPSLKKINPSDCVDMECDGMKKVLIKDLDGGFLGGRGAVVPQAEFGWDDPSEISRGLGDYRIPKTLLTATDGTRIPVSDIADKRGIIRSPGCTYKDTWQAYDCHGSDALNYEMLVIESMDEDTELRRLSPVALLGNRYIDLNNGPQDHGWCAGYTCQKRISTFYTIVASGNHFDIFFTGYAPKHLRLHLLNVDNSVTMRVAIWYARPERLDVIRAESGLYIHPQNSIYDATNDFWTLQPATNLNQGMFKPPIDSGVHGANYMDMGTKLLYVTLRGPEPIDIVTVPAVFLAFGFPSISVDDFFGEKLVSNLANLLGVPSYKIRIVEVVRETDSRRRKRDTSSDTVTYTIMYSDEIRNATAVNDTAYNAALLNDGSTVIVVAHQTGSLSSMLGANVTTLSVTQASDNGTTDPTNNTDVFFTIPTSMAISPLSTTTEEYLPFAEQPVVTLLDEEGNTVNTLDEVFEVTVSLDKSGAQADAAAQLTGTASLMFSNGVARFSDLLITHSGSYNINFQISQPLSTSVTSAVIPIVVSARTVSVAFVESSDYVMHGGDISITLELQNSNGEPLENIGYKGHTWKASVSLDHPSIYDPVRVASTATTNFIFNPSTGRLTTTNLQLSNTESFHKYNLQFRVYTEPGLYDITTTSLAVPFYSPDDTIALPTNVLEKISIEVAGVQYRTRTFESTEMFETFIYNFLVTQIIDSFARISNLRTSTTTGGNINVEFDLSADTAGQINIAKENLQTGLEGELPATGVTVASQSCIFEVNNVCYGTTSETNTSSLVPTDGIEAWVYVIVGVVAAILLAAAFIATSCFLKRAQSNKVSATGCLDASSSRGSTPLGDSFYTGSTALTPSMATPTGEYYSPRTGLTPVQT